MTPLDTEQSNIGRTFGQYVITRYRYSDEAYTASYYDAVCNQCHSVVLLRIDLHRDTARVVKGCRTKHNRERFAQRTALLMASI